LFAVRLGLELIQEQIDPWIWSEAAQTRKKFSLDVLDIFRLPLHFLQPRRSSDVVNRLK
jgi:hypothetical protein